jgi:hypothetical protein
MEKEKIEHSKAIAIRIPPGDKWSLIEDTRNTVHESLTDTLEAYFRYSQFKGDYRLSPLEGKLYAIEVKEKEVIPDPVKHFDIYGDPK